MVYDAVARVVAVELCLREHAAHEPRVSGQPDQARDLSVASDPARGDLLHKGKIS